MIDDVVEAIGQFIERHRGEFDVALAQFDLKLHEVFRFETEVCEAEAMPCIMLGNPSAQKSWVAAPYLIEIRYELPIIGYLAFDDNERNAKAIRVFCDVVSRIFEYQSAEVIDIPDSTYQIHFHSEPPLDVVELDYAMIGNAFCRSFTASLHFWVTRNTWLREG